MTGTATVPSAAVSARDRGEIANVAAWLLPELERGDAGKVRAVAETLLNWVSRPFSEEEVQNRMRAIRQQHSNTPAAYHRSGERPQVWVQVPSLTPEEFLAQADILYGFIAAGEG